MPVGYLSLSHIKQRKYGAKINPRIVMKKQILFFVIVVLLTNSCIVSFAFATSHSNSIPKDSVKALQVTKLGSGRQKQFVVGNGVVINYGKDFQRIRGRISSITDSSIVVLGRGTRLRDYFNKRVTHY